MTNRFSLRLKPAFGGCLALLLLAAACTQTPPDTRAADEVALRDLDAQWSKSAAARDLNATVAVYADDALLLAPNAPIATTREAIRAGWAAMLVPEVSLAWQASKVEVARSGDLGYVTGVYQLTMKDAQGKSVEDKGKTLCVFRKMADGKWKAIADTFNSDLPVPGPPPPAGKKK